MPQIYIFDAVGTVLKPVPDVVDAYHDAGLQHGSKLTRQDVANRFKTARQTRFSTNHSALETAGGSLPSSDAIEHQLWEKLIGDIFNDVKDAKALFEQLWEHFANPSNWQLYDDVETCWSKIRDNGGDLYIASNFDSRLHEIVRQFPIFKIAKASFCSAEVGFRKPDPMFYEHIATEIGINDSQEVMMVGDDFENDFVAPSAFGWKAIYLDRKAIADPNSRTITSLEQLY